MKTLLCPIDFSAASRAIVLYAVRLAQEYNAKIVLTAANPVFKKIPAGEWNPREETDHLLSEWQDWITHQLQVRCETRHDIIKHPKQLSILSDQFDILVVGVKKDKAGAIQNYAGLDLLKVIRETLAPILLIPEKYPYGKIGRLLYAYDYRQDSSPPLQQLKWLADWFSAEVTFISILPGELPVREEDRLGFTESKINSQWASNKKIKFESISFHNVSRCLEHYLSLWETNDLLVLSVNHANLFDKLWHKSVVKQLLHYGTHPYVVLHR